MKASAKSLDTRELSMDVFNVSSHTDNQKRPEDPEIFGVTGWGCFLLVLVFWAMAESVLASPSKSEADRAVTASDSKASQNDDSHSSGSHSSLWLRSLEDNAEFGATTLGTEVDIEVSGPIMRATVRQTFNNPSQVWTEGIYTFPLPETASVDQLRMIVGDTIIEGQIKEKAEAKKVYQQAKAKGQRASLLNHHQANVFTTSVANIAPSDKIVVEFEFQQLLDFKDGEFALRFPMVTTPKYTPKSAMMKPDFVLPINKIRSASEAPGNPVSISMSLKAGVPIKAPVSHSHLISTSRVSESQFNIDLTGSAALSNRDFLLSWQLEPSSEPIVSVLREDRDDASYGMLMVVPPIGDEAKPAAISRDLVFVLDVSGSMEGESIVQAKSALLDAVDRLRPEDQFNLIWFNTQAWHLFPESKQASTKNIQLARHRINNLRANGGTNMSPALNLALGSSATNSFGDNYSNQEESGLRQIIFITDGAVGNEDQLFSQIKQDLGNSRLFTVGIGSAPNSYFMRKAARAGRGSFTYVGNTQEVQEKMGALLDQLASPSLTDMQLDLQGYDSDILPDPLPDLYLGEPVYAVFKANAFPEFATITGDLNGMSSYLRLPLDNSEVHTGIAQEWARRKIDKLLEERRDSAGQQQNTLKEQIIDLAKQYHQVSPFTSLVAVDVTPVRAGGALRSDRIPANRPKGWQGESRSKSKLYLAKTSTDAPAKVFLGAILILLACFFLSIKRIATAFKHPLQRVV